MIDNSDDVKGLRMGGVKCAAIAALQRTHSIGYVNSKSTDKEFSISSGCKEHVIGLKAMLGIRPGPRCNELLVDATANLNSC